jgi:hypothetical protein
MDLGLTGEIEEVDEGNEPESFWRCFPSRSSSSPPTGGHWHRKGATDKYATRLFSVEFDSRPKSSSSFMWTRRGSAPPADNTLADIKEIGPFTQSDVSCDGIFVLDNYFEIYM